MKPKYPINSEEPFLDAYVCHKTGYVQWFTIRRGKVIDQQITKDGVKYTVDPWASGHYGHKRYGVLEKDICPTAERIEECRNIAPVKTCIGWRAKNEALNSQHNAKSAGAEPAE